MSDTEPTVGDLLRACRIRRGWSAREVSQRAGLSPSVAGKIENGTIVPSLRVFAQIARALRLSRQEIATLVLLAGREAPETGE